MTDLHTPWPGVQPPPPADPQVPAPGVPAVVRTGDARGDGLARCERCGATEASLNVATGMLRCGFCRHEWRTENALEAFDLDGPASELSGIVVGSGTAAVTDDPSVTLRCGACGAEVVIDATAGVHARCHWCRNTLSLREQVPNGAVPDMVLPFQVPKADAVARVAEFVGRRKFFALRRFRKEFTPENVMGVYLPYMVVDANVHAHLTGEGEHQTRSYTVRVGSGKNARSERRYDADVYDVERSFDLHVDDLTLESSAEWRERDKGRTSNNVVNAVLPFDVENAVRYDPRYLQGFTSERRDIDVDGLREAVHEQVRDIARWRAGETIEFYDRGVRWDTADLDVRGERWVSAYLPVWLYSYQQKKRNGSTLLHYVAVNGRTGETMGSVPLNLPRLVLMSTVVEFVSLAVVGLIVVFG